MLPQLSEIVAEEDADQGTDGQEMVVDQVDEDQGVLPSGQGRGVVARWGASSRLEMKWIGKREVHRARVVGRSNECRCR